MHILHVITKGLWKHMGGPAEIVPRLCSSLGKLGCDVTLMTLDGPFSEATLECSRNGVKLQSYPFVKLCGVGYSSKLSRDLSELTRNVDVVHDHGLWQYPNWAATKWARRCRKPLVITPHGVLTKGMLEHSRLKKAIVWALFDRTSIAYASTIQAFTEAEMREMKPRIKGKKVAIIPNGVDIWDLPDRDAFEKRFPQTHKKKVLLFFARVHPIKGVFDLIDAWKIVSRRYPEWHLVIAGGPEAECIGLIDAKIKQYRLETSVTLAGPQFGSHRLEAYAAADAFVLPSYGEGFSTSILEAMACRLPIIYTIPCNFPEASKRGAGFLGKTGIDPLVNSLKRLMRMSDSARRQMGSVGRKLVEEEYTWPKIGKQWLKVYDWIVSGSNKPSYILDS